MWKNEEKFRSFNIKKEITAGIDLDGDIGFLDEQGYSIGIYKEDGPRLRDWLINQFPLESHEIPFDHNKYRMEGYNAGFCCMGAKINPYSISTDYDKYHAWESGFFEGQEAT